jgi:type IV pilus assembly protein PilM
MFSSLFSSNKVLGLDIGTSTIKLAELEVTRRGATLNAFALCPTPPKSVAGEITEPLAISEAIRSLAAEINTKRKNIASGLWGSSVIVKRISIPQMDEKLVAGQIRWEAEQYIPFDINEVNVDFKILKGYKSNPDTMDILLVAARHDAAFVHQDIIRGAGLNCSILDIGGFALANCFLKNFDMGRGQTVALLNLGASLTNFVVVENGEVVFCRDIAVGGQNYTSEIQKGMGISFEEAESMKISTSTGSAAPDEVMHIITRTHDSVAEEVQSSLDFFLNTTPGIPIQQCFVTGGASRTPNLLASLSRQTKIQMEILDPLRGIKINERNLSPSFVSEIRDFAAISLGLGFRTVGDV